MRLNCKSSETTRLSSMTSTIRGRLHPPTDRGRWVLAVVTEGARKWSMRTMTMKRSRLKRKRRRCRCLRKPCLGRGKRGIMSWGRRRAHKRIVGRGLRIKRIGSARLEWKMRKRMKLRPRGELLNSSNSRGSNWKQERPEENKCRLRYWIDWLHKNKKTQITA
jgi:hypothetical protein